ncbi:hypothetical protein [Streptomyces sp. NPDC021622]|uniref:hypothetical protein n=1 Tax=Streptomyces sp. NPDC021622 TaxID=3155013 RepID=UPI0033E66A01
MNSADLMPAETSSKNLENAPAAASTNGVKVGRRSRRTVMPVVTTGMVVVDRLSVGDGGPLFDLCLLAREVPLERVRIGEVDVVGIVQVEMASGAAADLRDGVGHRGLHPHPEDVPPAGATPRWQGVATAGDVPWQGGRT